MRVVINALINALGMLKGFDAATSLNGVNNGKMLIEYDGKRYIVQLTEIEDPSEDIIDDIRRI